MKTPIITILIAACTSLLFIGACNKDSSTPPANPPAPPTPGITAISPTTGSDSTVVTIRGKLFGTTPGGDSVFFNGKLATLISSSDTLLTARVPTLAGDGYITVKANGNTIQGPFFDFDTSYWLSPVAGGFNGANYISTDGNGNLFVSTQGDSSIYKIGPQGNLTRWATVPYCNGTSFDTAGNLFVASQENFPNTTTIYKINPSGVVSRFATDSGVVFGLAIDAKGNLYAGNNTRNSVDKITPQGVVSVFAGNLPEASSVAIGGDGNIYATTNSNPNSLTSGTVVRITPSGAVSTVRSGLRADGIAVDNNNKIYITSSNGQVIAIQSEEYGTTIGLENDTITTHVVVPIGITVDKTGKLYVVNNITSNTNLYGNVIKLTPH
ncbi:IPT/TIG domain-containing protein [Puia dinghuensis]|uniref:IPT/TIG domain-containing protein n=1 Tax=Puia dinghuensis TaxID=1792502 RepID=A0A8J2XW41_9BACT|nr:IPT/TIG domain-containing protein [Puia dinghuensis]GGB21298.1 hypothetical protein GCM10011511_51360 [Puia dinghuensis]